MAFLSYRHCRSRKSALNRSSETVIHSEAAQPRRSSSVLSHSTFHTALRSRYPSARRSVSKVFGTMQKRKKSIEQELHFSVDSVGVWVEDARPGMLLTSDTQATSPAVSQIQSSNGSDPTIATHNPPYRQHYDPPIEVLLTERPLAVRPKPPPPRQPRTSSWESSAALNDDDAPRLWYPLRLRVSAKAGVTEVTLTSSESLWAVAQIHAELPALPAIASAT